MDNILKELHKILPSENFKQQPNSAKLELWCFEDKYKVNTKDFLTKDYSLIIPEEDIDKWLNAYSTFKFFDGQDNNLNSI